MQIDARPAHLQATNVAIDEATGRMSACLSLLPQACHASNISSLAVQNCGYFSLATISGFTRPMPF